MKKIGCFLIVLFLISCNQKTEVEKAIEQNPVELNITRFDKIFYETPIGEFNEMKAKYPAFFPKGIPDTFYINRIKNPLYRELYQEVQKKYADITPVKEEIETLFGYMNFYFPKKKTPKKITTLISEMDYENKVIYTDSLLIISLDLYLGKDHKFYEFPNYFKQTFQRSQILPDIVTSFSTEVIPQNLERSFLSQMIYFGKELYLKDILLPNYQDFDKIGYTKEQYDWSVLNESEIWRYFIENNLIYSPDTDLTRRFIAPAPFSKFYLEIDNESPGRIGTFIGWQIIKAYMKNNNVSLANMLKSDAQTIFEKSKYKPKKQP